MTSRWWRNKVDWMLESFFPEDRQYNVWNTLSTDCVYASRVNVFKNRIDTTYLAKAGYI